MLVSTETERFGARSSGFAAGLAAGAVAIAFAVRDPPAALVLLVVAAIAGLIVAIACPLLPIAGHALAFLTGAALTLNAPPQAIATSAAVVTQLATAVAALVVLGLVGLTAAAAQDGWQRIGIRIVGSWIAASTILVLALRLAR